MLVIKALNIVNLSEKAFHQLLPFSLHIITFNPLAMGQYLEVSTHDHGTCVGCRDLNCVGGFVSWTHVADSVQCNFKTAQWRLVTSIALINQLDNQVTALSVDVAIICHLQRICWIGFEVDRIC